MELTQVFALLAFAGLISFINERFMELVVVPRIENTRFGEWKVVISFVTGFGVSALLAIDFISPLAAMFGSTLRWVDAGWVVSAVVVGCGSPVIHDVLAYISAVKGQAKAREFLVQETAINVMDEAQPEPQPVFVPSGQLTEQMVQRVVKNELESAGAVMRFNEK